METYQFELVEVFYIPSLIELYLLTYIIILERDTRIDREQLFSDT